MRIEWNRNEWNLLENLHKDGRLVVISSLISCVRLCFCCFGVGKFEHLNIFIWTEDGFLCWNKELFGEWSNDIRHKIHFVRYSTLIANVLFALCYSVFGYRFQVHHLSFAYVRPVIWIDRYIHFMYFNKFIIVVVVFFVNPPFFSLHTIRSVLHSFHFVSFLRPHLTFWLSPTYAYTVAQV